MRKEPEVVILKTSAISRYPLIDVRLSRGVVQGEHEHVTDNGSVLECFSDGTGHDILRGARKNDAFVHIMKVYPIFSADHPDP